MNNGIRNIGIFAHVDAGKTSITENMLFLSGAIKSLGSVDDGTTKSDSLPVEKERGISVRSSLKSFYWEDYKINLVDTPGHVDFSADVERVIQVIDSAILVISAIDGVQSHTDTIWWALKERKIPIIVFINKIDRPGVYLDSVISEIEAELENCFIPIQQVENEGQNTVSISSISLNEQEAAIEKIAENNDVILELFIENKPISNSILYNSLKEQILSAELIPVLFGSAKLELGVKELLDLAVDFFPPPKINLDLDQELSAKVYSLENSKKLGKLAYVRIFQGMIKTKETVFNHSLDLSEKVNQLFLPLATKMEILEEASAGDIVAIQGLPETKTGNILGQNSDFLPPEQSLNNSLLSVQLKALNSKDYADLARALQLLSDEDPSLEFEWFKEEKELNIKVLGKIQIEVIQHIILSRFDIETKFEEPTVIFKETPSSSGYGIGHYTMPKPCWAIVKFLIEKGPRGSGVQYKSLVRTSDVHQKYQNEVERTIPLALKQGIKGWEVTDINITLVEGEDHQMHSRPGNFVLATPMGIMNALNEIGTDFLEPILSFKIIAHIDLLGKITAEIIQMRGSFESPLISNKKLTLKGKVPLITSLNFPVKLSSISGGKAKIITQLDSYQMCDPSIGVEREFKGISPLDRSKYILKMRKALE